jgi:hypothetical protein
MHKTFSCKYITTYSYIHMYSSCLALTKVTANLKEIEKRTCKILDVGHRVLNDL